MTHNHATARRLLLLAVLVLACGGLVPAAPAGAQAIMATKEIARQGFGDYRNSYSWSMAWFKGKLYVGTAREANCLENATVAFYYPTWNYYKAQPASDLTCPPNMWDMDLRAEIWQYTPDTRQWKRVFQSPNSVPNPRAPGKFTARDAAFRGMAVYRGQLYIGDVTEDEIIPENKTQYPPRILRTKDGEHFTPLPTSPKKILTFKGTEKPIGFRAMTVFKDRLYVTVTSGLTGDGVVMRVEDPGSRKPRWKQITPQGMQVFEMEPFNDHLYVGTGNDQTGYGVFWTNAENGTSSKFNPVITNAGGRGKEITSVVSMHVFKKRLYVGASGWYTGQLMPSSEMVRINEKNKWQLVAGKARATDSGQKAPISGLPDGMGNLFNTHFWRMQEIGGALMVGTNDSSWSLRDVPLVGPALANEWGFDIYASCDGRFWWPITKNAFNDGRFNFGDRVMVTNPKGRGFIGSANHAQGTTIYRTGIAPLCTKAAVDARATAASSAAVRTPGQPQQKLVARPARVVADVQRCGTFVSWQRTPGAKRYRVLRADLQRYTDVPFPARHLLPGGEVPDNPFQGPLTRRGDLTIPGAWKQVGTTDGSWFADRAARSGAQHRYQVVAETAGGIDSAPSNLAIAPAHQVDSLRALAKASRAGVTDALPVSRLAVERRARYGKAACGR